MEEELERDMKPRLIGETWRKYPNSESEQLATFGKFECQYCGEHFETYTNSVKQGQTRSCGCQRKGVNKTHGFVGNKFYSTWWGLVSRCTNPKNKKYKDYGGRGITVCEEWLNVTNFVAWAEATHPNIPNVSIDRINNDKGYSPENCRWADRVTQSTNQRKRSTNTSGFVGVYWVISTNKWAAKVGSNNKLINIGAFKTKEEAVQARDNYIIENNLPHKLSTEYKQKESQ